MKWVLCALFFCGIARADKLALLPITREDPKLAPLVESALVEAAKKIGTVVNLEGAKLRGPRSDKGEPRTRAQNLLREQSASLVVITEPQPLADGAVVYLQVIDASGKTRGSTTVVLSNDALTHNALERPLRGGLVQILEPQSFTGRLALQIDVKGAQTEIDGHAQPKDQVGPVTLSVGPHAVRVTHPAYHDWLRFVDVSFDETRVETTALAAFPLTEGEMAEKRKRGPVVEYKLPWYRTWWALTVTGVVLAGATVGIVFGARAGVRYDHDAHYTGVPTP
jgi:hypothetical protein